MKLTKQFPYTEIETLRLAPHHCVAIYANRATMRKMLKVPRAQYVFKRPDWYHRGDMIVKVDQKLPDGVIVGEMA